MTSLTPYHSFRRSNYFGGIKSTLFFITLIIKFTPINHRIARFAALARGRRFGGQAVPEQHGQRRHCVQPDQHQRHHRHQHLHAHQHRHGHQHQQRQRHDHQHQHQHEHQLQQQQRQQQLPH